MNRGRSRDSEFQVAGAVGGRHGLADALVLPVHPGVLLDHGQVRRGLAAGPLGRP
jgi:hypothetical protein